jgi:hypothetical protein
MNIPIGLVSLTLWAGMVAIAPAQAQDKPAAPPEQPAAPAQPAKDAVAPDIHPEALWDGRKLTPFHAMDFPKMVKAADADFMDDTEYVLGLTLNGESRAYPTRFASFHHIINDKIGDAFVTVTY